MREPATEAGAVDAAAAPPGTVARRRWRSLRAALPLVPVALLVLAAWALHRELIHFSYRDVRRAWDALPAWRIALAFGITAASYLLLTLYDVLALRYVRRRLPYPRVALTSFLAYAFGHNVGLSALSGGAIRLRLYSSSGLSAAEVTRVVAFCSVTFWVGVLAAGGPALLAAPAHLGVPLPLGAHALGALFCAAALGYLALCAIRRAPLRLRGLAVAVPGPGLALAQVVVAAADWLLAALVLAALLPPEAAISFPALVALFVAAQVAGLVSQVPGGLGVFEAIVVAALSPRVPADTTLATLLAYRAVYYLVPFGAAIATLSVTEAARHRGRLLRAARTLGVIGPAAPTLAAAGTLLAGAVLLFSGATPTLPERLAVLRRVVPLPLVELSHFGASIVGVTLLVLARALQRRLDAAWVLTLALLGAGAALSLVKGLDWEEALLLGLLLAALIPFRSQFYRRSSLLAERPSLGWALAGLSVLGLSIWLGYFSYRHVEFRQVSWWQFAFRADAPRFLRATAGACGVAVAFLAARLLRTARAEVRLPTAQELAAVRAVVRRSPEAAAHLALVGDKAVLLDEEKTAFLAYGVERRTWVAMGDPIGPERAATQLAWRFREIVDRHHGIPCFYEVGPDHLPRYLDLGLALLKLGEEALVPLPSFSLEGPERRGLRAGHRRAERAGLRLELVLPEAIPPLLPELRAISDAWLAGRRTREKGFSLGFFEPRYLCEGPIALVRTGSEVVAFANLWTSDARGELSLDLMRHRDGAPAETMEFLFTALMLWGREQGYASFNLGMAPFSGFPGHSLAPLWSRAGAFLFQHGEHFYNFQGLRQFKEKFRPGWRPRYLAAPGGLALPAVLTAVAALVSRGLKGLVGR